MKSAHTLNRIGAALQQALLLIAAAASASAFAQGGFLETTTSRHVTLTSCIPDNGDQNPYAIIVAPVSAGSVHAGDVLIDNFNNSYNLQGTGSTIVDYNPSTRKTFLFAKVPDTLPGFRPGVGLTTAMTMLKSGWVIVGDAPSTDGTAGTLGDGCLVVLDSSGRFVETIKSEKISAPWGNMAVIDNGSSATLFVSNSGFNLGAADKERTIYKKATVLRIELDIPEGKPPVVSSMTVVASGLSERAARDVFLIGPTGLALGRDGTTLYVSDALKNRVIAVPNATTRADSAGEGTEVTNDGLLRRPLAMVMAPNGDLLVTNGKTGQVVEVDPATGKQLYAQWIDTDRAQTPAGNGDLFGIAVTPTGDGFYYVEDDMNTLVLAK
jgi:DNA-binding beta-propeller fold protein YncE